MTFLNRIRKSRKGFTLIEIMIVVLIIGILLAIAVPNFVQARDSSRARSCVSNLKQIDAAKQQFAMDNRLPGNAPVTQADLVPTYIKGSFPQCPSGGTYTINNVDTDPTCSIGGTHRLP
jgi:prepilin-type N-terminal cleavage/methylation domain-containing protein